MILKKTIFTIYSNIIPVNILHCLTLQTICGQVDNWICATFVHFSFLKGPLFDIKHFHATITYYAEPRFCYVVFNSQNFNATEVHLRKWCCKYKIFT
jgi:hypothetical protein